MNNATTPATMTRYTARRCPCGCVSSVMAANSMTNVKHAVYGWAQAYLLADGTVGPMVNGALMIRCRGCGKDTRASRVYGTVKASVKCNAICTHAKGHSCECSCGGKNHGAGYEASP